MYQFPIDLTKPCDKKKKETKERPADTINILSVGRNISFPSNSIGDNFIILEGNKKLSRCFISFDELRETLYKICQEEADRDSLRCGMINALIRTFLAEAYLEDFDCIDLYNMTKYFKHLLYNLQFVDYTTFD